jgi:hypothetical protein
MRWVVVMLLALLSTVFARLPGDGYEPTAAVRAEPPKEKARGNCSLTITHDGNYTQKIALVTLYQDGKPFRSAELEQGSPEQKKVTWEKLPVGVYEVHFEAQGFKKFVKRVVLAEDGPEVVLRVQLDMATPYTLGGGPSVWQLAQEIEQLKKEQIELRRKVDELQAEVKSLKK